MSASIVFIGCAGYKLLMGAALSLPHPYSPIGMSQ